MTSEDAIVQFQNINVNRLDEAAGVFIGNNRANYWRSMTKNNTGFGNVSGSVITKTLSIVVDNDAVDTVICDTGRTSGQNVDHEDPSNQLINFEALNINALNTNSAVVMGNNRLNDWRAHHKENKGFGNGTGVSIITDTVNAIDDRDIIDTPISDVKAFNIDPDNK